MIFLDIVNKFILSTSQEATKLVEESSFPSKENTTFPTTSPFFIGASILGLISIDCVTWFSLPFSIKVPAEFSKTASVLFLTPLLTETVWIISPLFPKLLNENLLNP